MIHLFIQMSYIAPLVQDDLLLMLCLMVILTALGIPSAWCLKIQSSIICSRWPTCMCWRVRRQQQMVRQICFAEEEGDIILSRVISKVSNCQSVYHQDLLSGPWKRTLENGGWILWQTAGLSKIQLSSVVNVNRREAAELICWIGRKSMWRYLVV